MATTTNYSWSTPDDTALVKDGAAAIRTLGSSADTTVKNLNPETTLGDIAYRSSTANVKTRLGLGTAGQVLTVNSGATAPEWATPAGGGGYTELATGTLSGATTTISGISGSYKDLILYVYDYVISSTGGAAFIRINGSSSSIYYSTGVIMEGSAGTAVYTNNGGTSEFFTGYGGNTTQQDQHSTFIFYDYANSTASKNYQYVGTSFNVGSSRYSVKNASGAFQSTSAITSLEIHSGSNTFTAGTYYLYGVK
jgi:hypothetical protein